MCFLGKTLLAFALLHFVFQGEICLLLQVSLDTCILTYLLNFAFSFVIHILIVTFNPYNAKVYQVSSVQSCPTLCDPKDCSLPGSSVHGISQARILEWVAISFSRGSSQPRDQTHISQVSYIGRRVLYH